jgi:hypothetical protein
MEPAENWQRNEEGIRRGPGENQRRTGEHKREPGEKRREPCDNQAGTVREGIRIEREDGLEGTGEGMTVKDGKRKMEEFVRGGV